MIEKPRGPLAPWIRSDEAGQPHAVFLRGLSLGALIGAAIAGSAIWDRRRRRGAPAARAGEVEPERTGVDAGATEPGAQPDPGAGAEPTA